MYDLSELPEIGANFRVELPPMHDADSQGIIAVGGNLSPGLLLSAYEQGMFPWFDPGDPILWWSPDPRFVLFLADFHLSKRSRRSLLKSGLRVRADRSFSQVMSHCAQPRPGQRGTWISDEMIQAYRHLHEVGPAHSIEVYDGDELVGGLYGINRGSMFCGESMFSKVSESSKFALAALVVFLYTHGSNNFIDSQVANPHVTSLGGMDIGRSEYLAALKESVAQQDISGWEEIDWPVSKVLDGLDRIAAEAPMA